MLQELGATFAPGFWGFIVGPEEGHQSGVFRTATVP